MVVKVGELAPFFKGQAVFKGGAFKDVSLDGYRGKWLALFFYPLDFTFVCPTEILEFSKKISEFKKLNAEVLGVSTDSLFSHKAWLKDLGELEYPLFSDGTHEVSRDYGVLLHDKGFSLRGLFLIDPDSRVKYHLVHDLGIGRNVDEVLRVLSALQTGELCPVGWIPGKKTLGKA